MNNKFLLVSDNPDLKSKLEKCLKELAPKALVLDANGDEVDIYASSFEDPGCLVFFDNDLKEVQTKLKNGQCVGIALVKQDQTPILAAKGQLYSDIDFSRQNANIRAFLNLSLFNRETNKLKSIEDILETLSDKMGQELKRVKSLHEKLVNFRSEEFKGVKVTSKFASGEKPGGEFFDVVKTAKGPIFLLSSSNSYISSSIVMAQMEIFYQEKTFSSEVVNRFVSGLEKEFLGLGLDLSDTGIFVAELELATMKVKTFSFGGVQAYLGNTKISQSQRLKIPFDNNESYYGDFRLERSDRYIILSPGLIKNMDKGIESKLPQLIGEGARDFLTKTFFELKKNRSGSFLEYDASAIYFEVDKNAILQV